VSSGAETESSTERSRGTGTMSAAVSGGRSRNRVHHPRRLCITRVGVCFVARDGYCVPLPRVGNDSAKGALGFLCCAKAKGGRHVFTIGAVAVALVVVVVAAVRRGRRLVSSQPLARGVVCNRFLRRTEFCPVLSNFCPGPLFSRRTEICPVLSEFCPSSVQDYFSA